MVYPLCSHDVPVVFCCTGITTGAAMGQLWMGSRERVRIFLLPHFVSEGHPIGLISALSQLGNRVASSLSAQGLSAQGLSAEAELGWPGETGGRVGAETPRLQG